MRRREFLALVGGTAASVRAGSARAQQAAPVIGFLAGQSPDNYEPFVTAFRAGLQESGFVVGQNVVIDYRWAEGHPDRLPALAADLVARHVNVIAATGGVASARAAKSATSTIPIVFNSGEDPVEAGLVASLDRPGGNLTGVSWFSIEVVAKRVELLHQLVPAAAKIALLIDPDNPETAPQPAAAQEATQQLGLQLIVLKAHSAEDIDAAFAARSRNGVQALVVASGPVFVGQRKHIVALAGKYAIPAIYSGNESPEAGGLSSYGNSLVDAYRRNGLYVARILKGDRPQTLPIDRSTKFELIINLKTAKALGLEISPTLLATADRVIE